MAQHSSSRGHNTANLGAQDVPFAYEAAGVFGAIRVARSRVHCVHEVHEVRLRLRLRRLLLRRMLLPLQPLQQMRRRIVLIICWCIDRRSGSLYNRVRGGAGGSTSPGTKGSTS